MSTPVVKTEVVIKPPRIETAAQEALRVAAEAARRAAEPV